MSCFPVEKPDGDKSWRPWEPSRKCGCRPAEKADEVEQATKAAVQAAICYALTVPEKSTTDEANAATSEPRMLGTKVIDEDSAKDPAIKKVKQLVEGGAGEDAGDCPRVLREYFVKHAYYTVIDNTVLIDGRAVIPAGVRSQMLLALHKSHGGGSRA